MISAGKINRVEGEEGRGREVWRQLVEGSLRRLLQADYSALRDKLHSGAVRARKGAMGLNDATARKSK